MLFWSALLFCTLIGYFFGCIITAEVIGHFKKVSLYDHGSGNPGMLNTSKVLGKKAAAFVLIGDILKTLIAVVLCWSIYPQYGHVTGLYAGLGCMLGHCFPFWHKFEGGKGVAVVCTAYILYRPVSGIIALACGGLCAWAKLGVKKAAACIPIVYCLLLLWHFEWVAFIPAAIMGALMAWLNLRQNRLQPAILPGIEAEAIEEAVQQKEEVL